VLCQSLPVTVSTNDVIKPLFTCAIPANAVAVGKALRITANLHGPSSEVVGSVYFNGGLVASYSAPTIAELNWSLVVTNIGGTSFRWAALAQAIPLLSRGDPKIARIQQYHGQAPGTSRLWLTLVARQLLP
jgi:hypothetical protein